MSRQPFAIFLVEEHHFPIRKINRQGCYTGSVNNTNTKQLCTISTKGNSPPLLSSCKVRLASFWNGFLAEFIQSQDISSSALNFFVSQCSCEIQQFPKSQFTMFGLFCLFVRNPREETFSLKKKYSIFDQTNSHRKKCLILRRILS